MNNSDFSGDAVRDVLSDAFVRVRDQVQGICGAITQAQATYRPDADANSISWLIWHLTRVQDDHVCGITGEDQVWTREGWHDRFGLPFGSAVTGYGHSSADVEVVRVVPELLIGYQVAVHAMTQRYVEQLTAEELARIVDTRWDPPVTVSVRLVSVLSDCLAHLGQADYVRGLAERAGF